jgi:hypothetical protein
VVVEAIVEATVVVVVVGWRAHRPSPIVVKVNGIPTLLDCKELR